MRFIDHIEGYCKLKVRCPQCGTTHKLHATLTKDQKTITDQCGCGTELHWIPASGFATTPSTNTLKGC